MSRDDIIRMAQGAGVWPEPLARIPDVHTYRNDLLSFATLVAAAEREACIRECEEEARIRTEAGKTHPEGSEARSRCFAAARAAMNCAATIRARSFT